VSVHEHDVRADMTFGGAEDVDIRQIRERYEEALRQLQIASRRVDEYRAEAERLGWENATLRNEVEKKRLHIDLLVMRMATAAGSA
jgi:hypothetical protein